MSKVIVIDDLVTKGTKIKRDLVAALAWDGSDIEVWHIASPSIEKAESDYGKVSYITLGWKQSLDALKTVDARLLILDLKLYETGSSPIVGAAKERIAEN